MDKTHDNVTLVQTQLHRASNDHQDYLRTPGLLGRRPWIGFVLVLLGVITFSLFAINLQTNGPLIQVDYQVGDKLHVIALHSSVIIRNIMISGFYIGEQVIIVIGFLLVIYFIFKRFWPELCMVVIAWGGEIAVFYFLSHAFNRHRPVYAVPVWHQMIHPGFPSGHSISAVMCYGLLAYLIVPKISSRFWKALIIFGAVAVMLFIGFSRIFVGDHYLTDVLAGYAIGIAWSGLVYTSVELIMWKRKDLGYEQDK